MKLSSTLAFLALCQLIYTIAIIKGWYHQEYFSIEHEDTIFTLHFMTWFIVKSVEGLKD